MRGVPVQAGRVPKSSVSCRRAPAQQHGVHQRAGDRAALLRQGDGHAGRLPDRLGLAQDDLENRAVDGAVGREEQHRADQRLPAGRSGRPGPRAAGAGSGSRTDRSGRRCRTRLLQVDAFGQAVGGNQQALRAPLRPCPSRVAPRPRAVSVAGDRLDAQLREQALRKPVAHVVGGRDEAAEDDGIGAVRRSAGSEVRQRLRASGPARLVKVLACATRLAERAGFAADQGDGSTSTASASSSSSSKTWSSQALGIRCKAVAKRAARGGRRRADAAHQRQRAPEGQPSPRWPPAPSTTPKQ